MEIRNIRKIVVNAISKGDIEKALKTLQQLLEHFEDNYKYNESLTDFQHNLILIHSRYNKLKLNKKNYVITNNEAEIHEKRIMHSMLELLEELIDTLPELEKTIEKIESAPAINLDVDFSSFSEKDKASMEKIIKEITKNKDINIIAVKKGSASIVIEGLSKHDIIQLAAAISSGELKNKLGDINLNVKDIILNNKKEAREATTSNEPVKNEPIEEKNENKIINLFLSYSHKDEEFKDELDGHLEPYKRMNKIKVWEDRQIEAGADWRTEIFDNLASADIVLLLISKNFINSDFCYSQELEAAMKRHKEGKTIIIPVIIRPCGWTALPIGKIQAIPRDNKPISNWPNPDDAYLEVFNEVVKVVDRLT